MFPSRTECIFVPISSVKAELNHFKYTAKMKLNSSNYVESFQNWLVKSRRGYANFLTDVSFRHLLSFSILAQY